MCLAKEGESPKAQEPVQTQSPRSPWAKLLNRQSSKPKLPRKITSSAKVNLNKYWSKFGELMSSSATPAHSEEPEHLVLPFSNYFYPKDPVKQHLVENERNHITDGKRFELLAQDGVKISENLAYEVREICYSKKDCFVCSLCC